MNDKETMDLVLQKYLLDQTKLTLDYCAVGYQENVNEDALTDKWLETGTSYIWKVGVITAIDPNKCDWVYLAIGTQRSPRWPVDIIGHLSFKRGENDDIRATIDRAIKSLEMIHPVFENNL